MPPHTYVREMINGCKLLGSLCSLPLGHLCADIGVDIPDEGEAAEGTQSSDHGEADDHQLDAGDGGISLGQACCGQSSIVADTGNDQNGSGVGDGGADTTGQGEEAVDGALVALAGEVLVVVDGFSNQTPLHLDGHGDQTGADGVGNDEDPGVGFGDHQGVGQGAGQNTEAAQQADTDDGDQIPLLGQDGCHNQNADHQNRGQSRSVALQADVAQNVGIHVGGSALCQSLNAADGDGVQNQSQESTVLGDDVEDVGDLDLLGFLLFSGLFLDSDSALVALLGQRIVQEDDEAADNGDDHGGFAVTGSIVAKLGQTGGDQSTADQLCEGGTKATGRRQGSTFGIVLGHITQKGAHADVHHGVAKLVDDLQNEGCCDHSEAAAQHGRHHEEGNQTYCDDGNGSQDPGTELVSTGLCLCETHIHDGAHQRIVHCVPDVPDQQHGCQNTGVDLHMDLQETGHEAGHHPQRDGTAAVAAAVADNVLDCQLVRFGFCH